MKEKDETQPGSGGNDKFEDYTDDVPSMKKQLSVALQIQRAAGSERLAQHVFAYGMKQHAIKMDDYDFTVNPCNEHDSRTFKGLSYKLADIAMKYCIVDARYKTPAIQSYFWMMDKAGLSLQRPHDKGWLFRKSEYVYDELMMLLFVQESLSAYRARQIGTDIASIKSLGQICEKCEYLRSCTESKKPCKSCYEIMYGRLYGNK